MGLFSSRVELLAPGYLFGSNANAKTAGYTDPDTKVWRSPTQRLNWTQNTPDGPVARSKDIVVVYNPETKQAESYVQNYTLGIAQPLTRNDRIAIYDPENGRWNPDTASNVDGLGYALSNDPIVSQTLYATTSNTVRTGYQRVVGKPLPPAGVASWLGVQAGQEEIQKVSEAEKSLQQQQADAAAAAANPQESQPEPTQVVDKIDNFEFSQLTEAALNIEALEGNNKINNEGDLIYPLKRDTSTTKHDYVRIQALNYVASSLKSGSFAFTPGNNTANGSTSVILPLQSGISDSNNVGWNEESITPMQTALAKIGIRGLDDGTRGMGDAVIELIDTATGNKEAFKNAIKAGVLESAVGTNLLPRLSRAIFNPNTELLFQGPQLRSFTYSFKLTPRSAPEAEVVKKIIGFFKFNMAPKRTASELFVKAPNVFRLTYIFQDGKDHPGLNLIKDCALQSFSVDYTPDGSYMSYQDGSMVSYNLTMTFMELTPIYSDDYKGDHTIGY